MMQIVPRVISVCPKENYHLSLVFENGEKGQFDASLYISPHSFCKLLDQDFFRLAFVEEGTVCWPDEIRFPNDTLYYETINYDKVHQFVESTGEPGIVIKKGKIPEVIAVKALPDYQLEITFSPNESKLFDAKKLLDIPCFKKLKDKDFFKRVYVDFHTINWPGDIDYDPENLYQESIPLESTRK